MTLKYIVVPPDVYEVNIPYLGEIDFYHGPPDDLANTKVQVFTSRYDFDTQSFHKVTLPDGSTYLPVHYGSPAYRLSIMQKNP